MKKRLSKIARDLNASISEVADFLRSNGFNCDEDPNESFSDEIVEIVLNNFPAYQSEKRRQIRKPLEIFSKQSEEFTLGEQVPLELKIIEAASKEKKLIERIIGFTEYDWHFNVAKYMGESSQPVEFNLFDEVLCDLLLTEQMSANRIGAILGFDIEKDPAEKEILLKAIKDLKDDKMLEGDESIMWLSDVGIDYAQNGVKFSTFTRNFELYFDLVGSSTANIKSVFSKLKSEKLEFEILNLPANLEEVRKLAEYQAQEIHFPDKNYILQSAELINAESFKAKVWVILLENFRENSIRTLVYDEKQNMVIDSMSEILDNQDEIKAELFDRLVKINEEIDYTEEEKHVDQIQIENDLIQKQVEIETAIENQDVERIKEIQNEIASIKRHFNSLEFEVELKRLFDETANDLWIISPWIKNATFKRIPFFEKYLKKGGRIFIAYSEPEEPGQIMANDEPLSMLLDLEKKYQNFYLHQLPAFHYKNVWLRKENADNMYYTGSYNILSFFVSQGLKKVRQEKMTRLDWNEEVQEEFADVMRLFSLKYVNKGFENFNKLRMSPPDKIDSDYLQKLMTLDNAKLKPFINQGISEFDVAYNTLETNKLDNLNYYRKKYFDSKISEYKRSVDELSKQSISPEKKIKFQKEFEKMLGEYADINEFQMSDIKVIGERITNLRTYNFSNQKRNNYKRG